MLELSAAFPVYASDCFYLLRAGARGRFALWWTLTRLLLGRATNIVAGYRVRCLDPHALFVCFHDIFVREVYRFETENRTPFIIDAGANIGIATLYFKSLYPQARILALEPHPQIFEALRTNVTANHLEGVQLLNAALWDDDCPIDFYGSPSGPESLIMSTSRRSGGAKVSVRARKLAPLIDQPVDMLKLDIEGAETRVLRDLAETGKLAMVRETVIEYHHHVEDGPSCLSSFLGILESAGYRYQISASHFPFVAHDRPQDILIRAYRGSC
ncbi:MAG TPA: FkbM family methyltransferase [Candidatus Acidoferrales bacterium]|nr:FkbM family methyltransferase [Candidatus Acidoferrales bacterium]